MQEVGFASDAYFDLLSAAPEIGKYLALGQQVLIIQNDLAYKIDNSVEGTTNEQPGSEEGVSTTSETEQSPDSEVIEIVPTIEEEQDPDPADTENPPAAAAGPCGALAGFPLLVVLGMAINHYGRRRQNG